MATMAIKHGVWVAALAFIVGCGSSGEPVGTVSGKITYQGSPVTEGAVSYTNSETGIVGEGQIQPDGSYTLATGGDGLPPATYKVAVTPPMVEKSTDPTLAPSLEPKEMPSIPEKYRGAQTSGLEAVVKEGENVFDFDLK